MKPRYNEVFGTIKIALLYQVSHYIRVKKQRNIKSWDQQNYLVIRGFCYIRPLYNEVPLYFTIASLTAMHNLRKLFHFLSQVIYWNTGPGELLVSHLLYGKLQVFHNDVTSLKYYSFLHLHFLMFQDFNVCWKSICSFRFEICTCSPVIMFIKFCL